MQKIYGVCGKIGSGKSTVCEILKNYNYTELSFAEPIKQFAINIGFQYYEVYGSQKQKASESRLWGVSGRTFMQRFGTDIMRDKLGEIIPEMKGESIWVKVLENQLELLGKRNIVISDCRFPDEAEMIRRRGGKIILVTRKECEENSSDHSSETQTIEPDYIIENDSTLKELEQKIIRLIL